MFHKILSIIACAVFFCASAQPSVTWLNTVYNFGAFSEDNGPVSCEFSFVNTGSEPVAIVKARASCGCTAPVYSRDAVAPGDTSSVIVTYNPAGRPGAFHKYVAVDFSYPDSRQRLDIRGTVIGTPSSVTGRYPALCAGGLRLGRGAVMMGEIAKGKMKTVFLNVYNSADSALNVQFENVPSYVDMRITPSTVPAGEQASVSVFYNAASCRMYGLVTDSVTVRVNNDSCTLPLMALIREDFSSLTPEQMQKAPIAFIPETRLDFGALSSDDTPVTRQATITNNGRSKLEIRRVYTHDTGIDVSTDRTSLKPGQSAVITVTLHPEVQTGAYTDARVNVITNDPTQPDQTIRVIATAANRQN